MLPFKFSASSFIPDYAVNAVISKVGEIHLRHTSLKEEPAQTRVKARDAFAILILALNHEVLLDKNLLSALKELLNRF